VSHALETAFVEPALLKPTIRNSTLIAVVFTSGEASSITTHDTMMSLIVALISIKQETRGLLPKNWLKCLTLGRWTANGL
jgi:hypothetical protein